MNTTKKINKKRFVLGSAVGATALGISFAALAHEPSKQNNAADHYGHSSHADQHVSSEHTPSESSNPAWNLSKPAPTERVESEYILSEHAFNPNVSTTINAHSPANATTSSQHVITDVTIENHGAETLRGAQGSAYPAKPSSPEITIIDEPVPAIGQVTRPLASSSATRVVTPVVRAEANTAATTTTATETRRVVRQVITPTTEHHGSVTSSNTEQQAMVMVVGSPRGAITQTTVTKNETLNFSDGSAYYGDVAGDQPHGAGSRTWADGSTYTGEFKHGVFHGSGRFVAKSGYEYDGLWHEGQMHGKGSVKWPGGISYSGLFDVNRKHGPGEFSFPDGSRLAVIFNQDVAETQATLIGRDGSQTPVDINIDHKQ